MSFYDERGQSIGADVDREAMVIRSMIAKLNQKQFRALCVSIGRLAGHTTSEIAANIRASPATVRRDAREPIPDIRSILLTRTNAEESDD